MESFIPCSNLAYFHYYRIIIVIIIPLFFFSFITISNSTSDHNNDFIKNSCGLTRYPDLCYQTLSPYAKIVKGNPTQLANAALNVTLESAQSTSKVVGKMLKGLNLRANSKEASAMKDCVETMEDSVDELRESLVVLMSSDLEGPDFGMKMSNVQTWVSAALTNEDTCLNGLIEGKFMNGKVKDNISKCLERVAELTSNALALINQLV